VSDKGWRLLRGCLLGVGLWQFALHGFFGGQRGATPSFWLDYVVPLLSRLAISAPFIVAGIITGCVRNPRRPERLAAFISSLAALAAMPPPLPISSNALLLFVFRDHSLGLHFSLSEMLTSYLPGCFFTLFFLAEAAVAGWVGAHSTRGSWEEFWREKGGAIIKGGLAAGAVGLVAELVRSYGQSPLFLRNGLLASPNGIAGGALFTALLVRWRPRPLVGAFAGSGIALFVMGISQLLSYPSHLQLAHLVPHLPRVSPFLWATMFLTAALRGAVAGVFAGRWERGARRA